jgi:hypothetical protein
MMVIVLLFVVNQHSLQQKFGVLNTAKFDALAWEGVINLGKFQLSML